jgi:Flp pilus assembly protein, pilin Flp
MRGESFLKDQRGATAVEYALIVSVLVLAIVTGLAELGFLTSLFFSNRELQSALASE